MTIAADPVPQNKGGDFATLLREVRQAGPLDRGRGYYLVRVALNLTAFTMGVIAFVAIGDSWWQLFTAAFFAFMYTQLSFIGHDAGHKQILRTRRANDAVGHLHGGLVGLSYDWWIHKHNRHHLFPGMPRPNLHHAQALVENFCARHRIDYTQCGLLRSCAEVLRHLHSIGAPLRQRTH